MSVLKLSSRLNWDWYVDFGLKLTKNSNDSFGFKSGAVLMHVSEKFSSPGSSIQAVHSIRP